MFKFSKVEKSDEYSLLEIERMMKNGHTLDSIGNKYGVSGNAIKKFFERNVLMPDFLRDENGDYKQKVNQRGRKTAINEAMRFLIISEIISKDFLPSKDIIIKAYKEIKFSLKDKYNPNLIKIKKFIELIYGK